jgi:hypothetical protein
LTQTTTIDPEVTEDAYLNHPFNKEAAISFVKKSCFDGWLKSVCVARFEDPEIYDHPRVLMQLLGDYLEISLKAEG